VQAQCLEVGHGRHHEDARGGGDPAGGKAHQGRQPALGPGRHRQARPHQAPAAI